MTSTEEKLEEAEYFLDLMKKDPLDHSKFKFNLSAFLSAARSITFIMQSEFKTPRFKSWYIEKKKEFSNNTLLIYFNNKRVQSVHKQVVCPNKHVSLFLTETISVKDRLVNIFLKGNRRDATMFEEEITKDEGKAKENTESKISYRWFFDDRPEKDLLELCEEYISYLRTLVKECLKVNDLTT